MWEGKSDAEAGITRPALALPTIHAAEEDLIEAVGEFEAVEGVAHRIAAVHGDAVAMANPSMALAISTNPPEASDSMKPCKADWPRLRIIVSASPRLRAGRKSNQADRSLA
jgi:hypothetical protein